MTFVTMDGEERTRHNVESKTESELTETHNSLVPKPKNIESVHGPHQLYLLFHIIVIPLDST